MSKTKIEWADYSWNPVVGCTPVSEGCEHCYAKRIYERFHPHESFSQVELRQDALYAPLYWKKPGKIFVNSMGDLFHPDVPDSFIYKVFSTMDKVTNQTFLILTKRHERMWEFCNKFKPAFGAGNSTNTGNDFIHSWPLPNVWLGVTVENLKEAGKRIPLLLETPAAVRFISVEPMLSWIDIRCFLYPEIRWGGNRPSLDWIICGGETGPGARWMKPEWARALRDQCLAAGVPFYMKQMTKKELIPDDLLVRQFPEVKNEQNLKI